LELISNYQPVSKRLGKLDISPTMVVRKKVVDPSSTCHDQQPEFTVAQVASPTHS